MTPTELPEAERRMSDIFFVKEVIQGGKIRPATYIHEIILPAELYFELKDNCIIDHESLAIYKEKDSGKRVWDPIAFFEFKSEKVVISFHHIFNREDFRAMIDRYLIIKAYGNYPLVCNWTSRMNIGQEIELVQQCLPKCLPKRKTA